MSPIVSTGRGSGDGTGARRPDRTASVPARVARAIHRLGEDGEHLGVRRLDDDVVGLGDGDAELVHGHRPHRLSVRRDHRELQAGNPDVEIAHRGAVDESQPHPLTGLEQAGPVRGGRLAVHQVGVGGAGDIGKVGRAHAHLAPGLAIRHGRLPAIRAHVLEEVAQGPLPEVVVVRLLLQLAEDALGVLVGPVGEQHDVFAIGWIAVRIARLDDDGRVDAALLLEPGVAVVPVGPCCLSRNWKV